MLEKSDLQEIARLIDERAVQTEERLISRLEETEDYIAVRFEEHEAHNEE